MEIQLARDVSTNSNHLQELQLAGEKGTKILCTPLHQNTEVYKALMCFSLCQLESGQFSRLINLDMNRALSMAPGFLNDFPRGGTLPWNISVSSNSSR